MCFQIEIQNYKTTKIAVVYWRLNKNYMNNRPIILDYVSTRTTDNEIPAFYYDREHRHLK